MPNVKQYNISTHGGARYSETFAYNSYKNNIVHRLKPNFIKISFVQPTFSRT